MRRALLPDGDEYAVELCNVIEEGIKWSQEVLPHE